MCIFVREWVVNYTVRNNKNYCYTPSIINLLNKRLLTIINSYIHYAFRNW